MNLICTAMFLSMWQLATWSAPPPQPLKVQLSQVHDGIPGEQAWNASVDIGHGLALNAQITVTAKGNGFLSVGNLSVRVYDDHDDGLVFDRQRLDIWFHDMNGDGYKDLILTGIMLFTDDKQDRELDRQDVASAFLFDPVNNEFTHRFGPDLSTDALSLPQQTDKP